MCTCGREPETTFHYLLICPIYSALRIRIFGNIPSNNASYKLLLYGSENDSIETNRHLFLKIQKFIKESKRFK